MVFMKYFFQGALEQKGKKGKYRTMRNTVVPQTWYKVVPVVILFV